MNDFKNKDITFLDKNKAPIEIIVPFEFHTFMIQQKFGILD